MTKEWKTRKYTIVGWISFGLFLLVIGVDIVLAVIDWPTISNYVTRRAADQPLFGVIVFAVLVWLIIHWFGRFVKKIFGKE